MRVLHVAAEAYPLIKTGGLADVAGALPHAQQALGAAPLLLLPGYPAVIDGLTHDGGLTQLGESFGPAFGASRVTLRRGTLPGSSVPVVVIDAPWLFRREGSPYQDAQAQPWPDNYLRFGLLGWVAAHIASGDLLPGWTPDLVHAHDWHAGLAPVYMGRNPVMAPKSVFTIHNLAFQGRFGLDTAPELNLPPWLLRPQGVEVYGELSFMKGALTHATRITTVSPTYAREMILPQSGHGLDGVLRDRGSDVSGILNGIDGDVWNPAADSTLAAAYTAADPAGKARNRAALQREAGLLPDSFSAESAGSVGPAESAAAPPLLLAVVSRLSEQKGLDLLLQAAPALIERGVQLLVLGSGESWLERGFSELAQRFPGRIAVRIGYDEGYSHRIFGGADAIVVPSRFEPCGLTQMYGLRYGTVPIAHRVGGLADTVVDEREGTAARPGNGFLFDSATVGALSETLVRAVEAHRDPLRWRALVTAGMACDHAWQHAARDYLALYDDALQG